MRAHTTTNTTTTKSGPRRMQRLVVLAIGLCALAIPATAGASFGTVPDNQGDGGSSGSSQPECYSDSACSTPTTVNAITGGSSGSTEVDSGYSSLNAISGSPADAPTFVSGSPSDSGDGFDWASALVGAGAGLALAALGAAALLTVRRRSTVATSPSTS